MPCIFYDKPYVFFGVRKIVFLWRIFCVFLALHFSFLMILMFSFALTHNFYFYTHSKPALRGMQNLFFLTKIAFSQKIFFFAIVI